MTSLPSRESSFSISHPWDKFGLTFKKEAPVSPVGLPYHQDWKERTDTCSSLSSWASGHTWISPFVHSHFTLFFSFLTSLHTSSSRIRCEINRLTEAIVTNFHSCIWSNPCNKLCVFMSMFAHMHTHATSGDSNLLDTVFGKYQRKSFQGFTFLAEVHVRDLITFKATLKEIFITCNLRSDRLETKYKA